jgi:hypothetical protein
MCGEKGYYFSTLNLKEDDIVIITIDPDIADIAQLNLEHITNFFKPNKVIATIKGIDFKKEKKDILIEYLQED